MRKLKTKKLKIQKFTIAASPQQFNIQHSTFNIHHCGIAATTQHSTFNIQNSPLRHRRNNSTFNIQHSTFTIAASPQQFNIQHSKFNRLFPMLHQILVAA